MRRLLLATFTTLRTPAIAATLLVVAAGCDDGGEAPDPGVQPSGDVLSLVLAAEPTRGEAPLTVRFTAELQGEPSDPARFECPTLAWVLGNGEVTISRAEACRPGIISRRFALSAVYGAAGSYDAYLRLVAADVGASNVVQVLVAGPTPTAGPRRAAAGPTIIIATAPAPAGTRVAAGDRGATAGPTPASGAAATIVPAAGAAATAAAAQTAVRATVTAPPELTRVALAPPPERPTSAPTAAPTAAMITAGATVRPSLPLALATEPRPSPTAAPALTAATAAPMPSATTGGATPPASLIPPTAVAPPAVPTIMPPPQASEVATSRPQPPTPEPSAPPRPALMAAQVLPADLYYLAGTPRRLWRIPANGDSPSALSPPAQDVTEYAVTSHGRVAYAAGGGIRVVLDVRRSDGDAGTVLRGASSPVWTIDGRRLAYRQSDAVWVMDLDGSPAISVAGDERPLAWSPTGAKLAIMDKTGRVSVVAVDSGVRQRLPSGDFDAAGWLPDRDVMWLAGAGAMLVALDGPSVQAQPLWPADVRVTSLTVRADLRLLAMVNAGQGYSPFEVDFTADTLRPVPIGGTLDLTDRGIQPRLSVDAFAWSPDGRNGALGTRSGLTLVDPTTGASVPLVDGEASRPRWALP